MFRILLLAISFLACTHTHAAGVSEPDSQWSLMASGGFGEDYSGVVGLTLATTRADGLGYYMMLEGSAGQETSPEYQSLNGNPRGDAVIDRFGVLAQATAGITYPVAFNIHLLGGLGYGGGQGYVELQDSAGDLGGANYFIEDRGADEEGLNVQVGAMGHYGLLSGLLAYNTFSGQVVIGVGLNFTSDWDLL